MWRLITRFVRFLESIPPQEEYISDASRRYWLNREYMEKMRKGGK